MGLEKLMAQYPAKGDSAEKLNRELCQLLVWLSNPALGDENAAGEGRKSDLGPVANPGGTVHDDRKGAPFHAEMGQQIIERTLKLIEAAPSQEEQIYYMLCLRWAHGWTPQQREWYFRWFHEKADRYTGGNSFAKFVDRIRADAEQRVPAEEKAALAAWLTPMASAEPPKAHAAATKPREFVKAWTLPDLEAELNGMKDRKPDLARGKQLYAEAQCAQCHLYRDAGGNIGPDLTAVAQRFGRHDILDAIIDPNKAVSDQYAMITLTVQKFGGGQEQVSGLMKEETSGTVTLLTDPLAGKTAAYYENVIVKREKANVSIMPPGLLFTLKAEEVADLLAYLGAK
jgi:putative heme-binding domain-containing protein